MVMLPIVRHSEIVRGESSFTTDIAPDSARTIIGIEDS